MSQLEQHAAVGMIGDGEVFPAVSMRMVSSSRAGTTGSSPPDAPAPRYHRDHPIAVPPKAIRNVMRANRIDTGWISSQT